MKIFVEAYMAIQSCFGCSCIGGKRFALASLLLALLGSIDAFKTATDYECYCEEWKNFSSFGGSKNPYQGCSQWKCDERSSCFPPGALVRGDQGQKIRMADLDVGSKVYAAGN